MNGCKELNFEHQSLQSYLKIRKIIKRRLDGYRAATIFDDGAQGNLYQTVYNAMEAAIQLFELRKQYNAGFSYVSVKEMVAYGAGCVKVTKVSP